METKRPVVLAILDGWGMSKNKVGNAFFQAQTPNLDAIAQQYRSALLQASGLAVGLTFGEPGNSEVGHLNMGAGRIVQQYLSRIDNAIEDKSFFNLDAIRGPFEHVKENASTVHFIGLLTSGTVHASLHHLFALLDLSREENVTPVLHLFLDGKDSGLQEGVKLLDKLNQYAIERKIAIKVATLIGRKKAMDRDNNWQLTEEAYKLIALGEGEAVPSFDAAIRGYYEQGKTDQDMPPLKDQRVGYGGIAENDAMIFFNFREDAIRQLARAFLESNFDKFATKKINNLWISTMSEYLKLTDARIAFLPPVIVNGLTEVLSAHGKRQFHITETEKYAHVTYFFNGLRSDPFPGEDDALIESYKEHEQHPEMRTQEITDRVVEELKKNIYDFIVLNFPNADVIAHTGNLKATIESISTVDRMIGVLQQEVVAMNGILIITGDHGNAEALIYGGTGERETKHNDSPVPFSIIAAEYRRPDNEDSPNLEIAGVISDVSPTILELLGIPKPDEMSAQSLLGQII